MATIVANGCFDILHDGHKEFLKQAAFLGNGKNRIVVCVNSGLHPIIAAKRNNGRPGYPLHNLDERMSAVTVFLRLIRVHDYLVLSFKSEGELFDIISDLTPCILVKGPDYLEGKNITGGSLAPVLILDTPEPESVKQMKVRAYHEKYP